MYIAPSEKAASASAEAVLNAPATSSGSRTIFIPRPPPPEAALRITGKPIFRAYSSASWASCSVCGQPGRSGSPASAAASRARTLFPISRSISGRGPIQAIPQRWTTSANAAFSERKP